MEYLYYIQEYYYYLTALIFCLIVVSLFSYSKNKQWRSLVNVLVIPFSIFTVYYIGTRDVYIGTDTIRYESTFLLYEATENFFIRKDPFFDFLNFIFAKLFDFQIFLLFCAFLYVFGALYGLRKIFKDEYYLPFLFFLISPYFMAWGVNVMRSGVAGSLFLIGLGVYYQKGKRKNIIFWMLTSVLFHISMFVPLLFFLITNYVKNTKGIFVAWLISVVLAFLNVNIIVGITPLIELLTDRVADYAANEGERDSWTNFFIFGFFPVIFAVYNILILKYKDPFYHWIVNAYMMIHIPFIILLNTHYAQRIGYLAEFMMPILLLFPLLKNPKLKMAYGRVKLVIIIGMVFLIKAYKVLII